MSQPSIPIRREATAAAIWWTDQLRRGASGSDVSPQQLLRFKDELATRLSSRLEEAGYTSIHWYVDSENNNESKNIPVLAEVANATGVSFQARTFPSMTSMYLEIGHVNYHCGGGGRPCQLPLPPRHYRFRPARA